MIRLFYHILQVDATLLTGFLKNAILFLSYTKKVENIMKIFKNILSRIGNTPLMECADFGKLHHLPCSILSKLEGANPGGSAKDRVALQMIEHAEQTGALKQGATIIEPTSGNTGIGLALVGAVKGYKVILTMPDSMTKERRDLLSSYGAQLVLTPGSQGMNGAVEKALELQEENEGSFIPSQFDNPQNPLAHYTTTGPEIWEDTCGKVDIFVAGIGTGGTLSGVGKFLKEQNPNIQIVGIEPAESPLITKGVAGPHGIQGIGANFIPKNYDPSVVDEVLSLSTEDAKQTAREFAKTQGVLVGISSGAALLGAKILATRPKNQGKTIVALLPDSGERYLSTGLFQE